jgi:hypothetical protein
MFKIIKENVTVYNIENGEYLGTIPKGDEIEIIKKWPFRTPTGKGLAAQISDDGYIILELNGETVAEEKKENKKGKKKNE